MRCRLFVFLGLSAAFLSNSATAEETYVQQNGQTYRQVQQTVRRPVAETRWVDQQETVYRQQLTTQMHDSVRPVYTPITQTQWIPRWHGVLNPFQRPYLAYHPQTVVHWQTRYETVQTPITKMQTVPETRTVKKPVRELKFVEEKQTQMVAVPRPYAGAAPRLASQPYGSVSRMQSDPPRVGASIRAVPGSFQR